MKKFLQKSLCQLQALLLLAVMFVAGISAVWAENSVEYSFRGGAKTYGPDADGISISCTLLYEQGANIYSGAYVKVESSEKNITRIELSDCSYSGYGASSNYGGLFVEKDGKGSITNNGETATWTGSETSVWFTTGNDFCVGRVEVFYEGEDDGSVKSTLNFASTAWNLSVNGETAVPTSGCHFDTRDVFSNADGVTMNLTNVAARGEGGLNSERKGTGYAQSWPNECYYSQYSTGKFALYFCNGEGFTINAPSGYNITKIVVNRASTYSMTNLIMDGVQNTEATKGTWTGEAESVAFSTTTTGSANDRILVSDVQVTLMPVSDPTTYTLDLTNASGASVTICGEAVTGDTYEATRTLKNSDVVVTGAPAGYKAEVTIEDETITIAWVEMPQTSITGYNDAPGSYSLDVKENGFYNFKIYFADNFAENYNYQDLPQLLNWTLPAGVSAGSYPYANSGSNELTVTLDNANVAGDYHLIIPAGVLSFTDGKTNPAIDVTWTLTAATQFRVGYYDYAATGEKASEYVQKELTGFDITAPEGVVFASLNNSACNLVLLGTWNSELEDYVTTPILGAEWSLIDGVVSIRFAEAYTAKGSYRFRIPEGAIVATDDRTNKSFEVSAEVDPHEYFDLTFNETEFESTFNTFTLTLPEGVTATSIGDFEVSYWDNAAYTTQHFTISDAEFTQTGRQLAVSFTAPEIPVDQNFSVIFEQGTIVTSDANLINNYKRVDNLYVRPVRMHFVKMGADSDTNSIELGAKLEEVSTLYVCFDEPIAESEDQWLSAAQAGATLTDANGTDVGFSSGSFYCVNYNTNGDNAVLCAKLSQTVSAPGVYTFRLPANVYTSTNGHKNEAVEFTFEIVTLPLAITNVSFSGTEGGVAMPITVNFSQKIASAENYEGKVYLQKNTESGYVNVTLDNYGWTNISDYSSSGWYGDVTYNSYAYINLHDADGSYGSFYTLEAGDYRFVIDKDIFTSVKGTKLEADYYYDFTVTAVPSAAVAGALDGKYYGTYYASRNWIVPEGLTAYYVDAVNNGEIHLVKVAEAGGVVNSNIGVLLESTAAVTAAPIAYTSQYGEIWANDNMLRGTTSDQLIGNDGWGTQYKYYMLSRKDGAVGFYWDPSTEDEGESLNNKAHKAYLRVPVEEAESNFRIRIADDVTTGIDSVITPEAADAIYNLQGQRVIAPAKGGVYVKNGKKIIVK